MFSRNDKPVVDVEFDEIAPAENDIEMQPADTEAASAEREVLCGVVLRRCPVVSFNPFSNVLVYERDGQLIQTNALEYHGEGYVEVE